MARRTLIVIAVLVVALLSASAAPTGTLSHGSAARVNCGARAMTFYFWPQGHQIVPSLKFSAYTTPHMEAYTARGVYDAFVDANGQLNYAKQCKQVGNLPARWASAKRKTITTTMIVNCVFPVAGELNAAKAGAGGVLTVTLGHTTKLILQGNLKATGSSLTYDTRFCRTTPAPAQQTPTKYSFTGAGATFSLNGATISYAFSGEVCGDPATTPWTITASINGGSTSKMTAVLPSSTATNVTSIVFKDSAGNELARATLQLTYSPGPPPTMTLGVVPSNALVTNIHVTGSPAAVTATPVQSC